LFYERDKKIGQKSGTRANFVNIINIINISLDGFDLNLNIVFKCNYNLEI